MKVRINGYVKGKALKGESFEEADEDSSISVDHCLSLYRGMFPDKEIDSIRIKVSKFNGHSE